ncbi:MAG TPA: PAS domain S-box protein, partial [Actinomycetota bacterium]|nr:PAS domain S-box protein [Actinomycetota bacterium]
MSEPVTLPQSVRTSLPRAAWLFVLAVVAAATVVVALYLPAAVRLLADGGWRAAWQPLLYVAGLVLAERFVVKVPLRNHRFSVGVCDMVIVLGVVFLDPPVLVIATGLGIAVSQVLFEAQPVKRLFNVPQYILSVAVAAAVAGGLVDLLQRSDRFGAQLEPGVFRPALAVVWVVAMAAFFLVNHSLVSIVVSLSTGQGFVQSWLRAAPVAAADWAASIAYGLIIAALLAHDQALLPLLIVPIGLTFLGNRAWARSLAQGQRMHSLYAAGRALSNRLGDTRAWEVFARQVADVLNCEGAAVFLGRDEDGALDVISTGGSERLTVPPSKTAWEQAAKGWATRAGWSRYTMVPMEADGEIVGYAAAFGPRVDADFTGDDTETLLTLANQGAAALVNEQLYRTAESERAKLLDIVEHSSDGIYTVGPDRTVKTWNAAMVALTGYQEDEAVGQKCFNLLRARDGEGVDMC